MITRAALFGEAARHDGQLSPRGDRVAFLAPRDGVTNLWVLSVDAMDEARPVTDERLRGITNFRWAADGATLLYLADDDGDENTRLYAVDGAGSVSRALTPAGARAEIIGLSANDPGAVVVLLNERDRGWPDVVRVELATGARTTLLRNGGPRGYTSVLLDRDNAVRVGVRSRADGGAEVVALEARGRTRTLFEIPFADAMSTRLIGFEADGAHFLMLDSSLGQPDTPARDRTALLRVDVTSGEKVVLGEGERADVVDVWIDPATGAAEAFATEYLRREWRALNADSQADIEFLDRSMTGDFTVVSRNADDTRWIVVEESPTTPRRSYLFDRAGPAGRRLTSLFSHRPELQQAALQPMTPVEISARDGATLVAYLTLPAGSDANGDARPEQPLPLVLLPHDGPWARDSYGFDAMHQWLANRGYAVLSVNFRGSAGFGKAFLNAGNDEWGGRIQEDLSDAVEWAVAQRIAEQDRVAIVGSGFGGYAALSGLAFTPDLYRCGASFAAPANLFAMLDLTPSWQRDQFYHRVADARTEAGRQLLRVRSPAFHAGRIRSPLLLAYGGRDPRLTRGETDQVAQAVRLRGILTYLTFPDEGRQLVRPQNRLSYLAVLEHFLGDCLGGRVEPVGASFEGAAINVYDGAVNVPGLSAFSRRPAQPTVQPTAQTLSDDAEASDANAAAEPQQ
ncbi:MAG: prolyl oligopeptidase family serine peptidase [Alphaproteobacteria bacterium]|nr:prolyl oligopeptidase family serine peptidase [Alphaproteobacteria bacterium]